MTSDTQSSSGDASDELEQISQDLWRQANELEESLHGLGTAEQWSAVQCLRDASGHALSACYWLRRHDHRYEGAKS